MIGKFYSNGENEWTCSECYRWSKSDASLEDSHFPTCEALKRASARPLAESESWGRLTECVDKLQTLDAKYTEILTRLGEILHAIKAQSERTEDVCSCGLDLEDFDACDCKFCPMRNVLQDGGKSVSQEGASLSVEEIQKAIGESVAMMTLRSAEERDRQNSLGSHPLDNGAD